MIIRADMQFTIEVYEYNLFKKNMSLYCLMASVQAEKGRAVWKSKLICY